MSEPKSKCWWKVTSKYRGKRNTHLTKNIWAGTNLQAMAEFDRCFPEYKSVDARKLNK